ncbi:hypothetical protein JCM3774_003760 [Rhodotorula dairenensis]
MSAVADNDHLARGIRSLALKHWNDACDQLAQAVEQATAKYGDLAPENVEPLILYGKALLGSAIAQSAVLGGAAPGADEAGSEAAGGAGAATAASSSSSSGPAASSSAAARPSKPNFHFGGDAEDDDDDDDGGEDAGEGGPGEDEQSGDEDEGGAAQGGDREDDLESAFQVLDMARATLEKQVDAAGASTADEQDTLKGKKERLAEVHRLLGDVATESEQFDNAVEEYTSALDLLTAQYAPSNRALSELHMLIALALDFVPNANERAVAHAEKAKKVLLLKLDELERVDEGNRDDKAKREIEDIKGLMGDVDMKIEDLKTVPVAPAPTATDTALEAFLRQSSAAAASTSGAGEVHDLTSLVKKKKKPVPAPGVVQEEIKKPDSAATAEENTIVVRDGPSSDVVPAKRKTDEGEPAEADGASSTNGDSGPSKRAKVEQDAADQVLNGEEKSSAP